MTRKDTILIAVVINAGLLAILFTTAVIYDTDKAIVPIELAAPVVDHKPAQAGSSQPIAAVAQSSGDEVDNVLKYYAAPSAKPIVVDTQPETYVPELIAMQSNASDEEENQVNEFERANQGAYVEVTVKRGDVLEKIARANQSSVGAIKRANNLQNENLSIGQVLKIPLKQNPLATSTEAKREDQKPSSKQLQNTESQETEPVYHIVKSGDNPWKIAKQYNVKYDDILRLNQLDEEKARNLKIGEQIRVR
jgi:peptidoglycan endopeptidase LytF